MRVCLRQLRKADFNPRPSCEGRHTVCGESFSVFKISIHVPLARDDMGRMVYSLGTVDFNPRPSCEGRRLLCRYACCSKHFNPRPSCEGRLCRGLRVNLGHQDFNPRPSCEGRPYPLRQAPQLPISIHVPLARDDYSTNKHTFTLTISIHVPLARDDAEGYKSSNAPFWISIHVPLARDDSNMFSMVRMLSNFNPRPSCEGRQDVERSRSSEINFNPRPSCEGRQLDARS